MLLYQKIVVWLEEEFSKLERIRDKESEYYQKQYQVCSQIYNKLEMITKYLSSLPLVQHLAGGDFLGPISSPSNSNEIENNQVSSIFTSRNVISNCLANEFPKSKPTVNKRGNHKKLKMFNCTICGEKFPNGQALGKYLYLL